jgi:hypothetical protein
MHDIILAGVWTCRRTLQERADSLKDVMKERGGECFDGRLDANLGRGWSMLPESWLHAPELPAGCDAC